MQSGIFGPGDTDLAIEPLAAPNEEFIHLSIRNLWAMV